MSLVPNWLPRAGRLLAIAALAAPALLAGPARAGNPSSSEIMELNGMSTDPARAADAVVRLRRLLAAGPDSTYRVFLHQLLLRSLVNGSGGLDQIMAEADSVERYGIGEPRQRMNFYAQLSDLLIRREAFGPAARYARRIVEQYPSGPDHEVGVAAGRSLLGQAQLGLGKVDSAIVVLSQAVSAAPDSAQVLRQLGHAYARKGRNREAIDAYVRALGVFPANDTTAVASLREVYRKEHRSFGDMEERIEAARTASRNRLALDGRRHDAPAPDWVLPDTSGRLVQLSQFKGQVLVIDFWGSWCGPCRAELPHVQSTYERYKDRGVAFIGINWERNATPDERRRAAMSFLAASGLTFPTVLDLDRTAVEAYQIEGFPTAYVIDREGRIRYRNVGFNEQIGDILGAQIESLIH